LGSPFLDHFFEQDTAKDDVIAKIENVKKKVKKRVEGIANQERTIQKLENDWEQRGEPGSKEQLEDKRVSSTTYFGPSTDSVGGS